MKTNRILKALAALMCVLMLAAPAMAAAQSEQPEVISQFAQTKLDLEPYRGKAIFLNFFTEWCPYCMEEMADIKKVFDDYDPETLQVILVHVWDGETKKETKSVTEKYGLQDMTFFEDTDGALATFVGLQGYPASLFVAADGTLSGAYNYAMEYDMFAEAVEAAGAKKLETAK